MVLRPCILLVTVLHIVVDGVVVVNCLLFLVISKELRWFTVPEFVGCFKIRFTFSRIFLL